MRLSDIQPQYFPRLHYFARMLSSDVFVVRDDVQFVRNHRYPDGRRDVSYQAHTPIKSRAGTVLLGVSVQKGGMRSLRETGVCYRQRWAQKHLNVIRQHYRRAPHLKTIWPELESLLAHRYDSVAELNIATICWALGRFMNVKMQIPEDLSLDTANGWLSVRGGCGRLRRLVLGSEIRDPSAAMSASERIAHLCRVMEADEYVAGKTAIDSYLDHRVFGSIELTVQDWKCPDYQQQHLPACGNIANLSVLDLLMNRRSTGAAEFLLGTEVCVGAQQTHRTQLRE